MYKPVLFFYLSQPFDGQTRHHAGGGFIVWGLPDGTRIWRHRGQAGLLPGKADVPRLVYKQPAYARQV